MGGHQGNPGCYAEVGNEKSPPHVSCPENPLELSKSGGGKKGESN